jgi:hypothetical protein
LLRRLPGSSAAPTKPTAEATQTAIKRGHLKDFVEVPYNGSKTSKYSWEQTINDVTINVRL